MLDEMAETVTIQEPQQEQVPSHSGSLFCLFWLPFTIFSFQFWNFLLVSIHIFWKNVCWRKFPVLLEKWKYARLWLWKEYYLNPWFFQNETGKELRYKAFYSSRKNTETELSNNMNSTFFKPFSCVFSSLESVFTYKMIFIFLLISVSHGQ